MLEQFIKGYAEAQDFPAEVINDAANSDGDQGYYFLEFDRALCSLKEIDSLGSRKALAIITLERDELNHSFEEEALQLCRRLEDKRQNLCNAICCPSASEQKLSFFALFNLEELSQDEFNQNMLNLNALCTYCYTGKRTVKTNISSAAKAYDAIDKLLLSAGINPQALYENFNRLEISDQAVLLKLNPYNQTIILKSLLCSELSAAQLVDAAYGNLKLQGSFFFTFDEHNLYLNTPIEADGCSAEQLLKLLEAHLKLKKELSVHYANLADENSSIIHDFSNFIIA